MMGEYSQAIIIYNKILEISPDHTKTLLMKGVAESNQDRHKNSILTFKKVLQSDPENLMAIIGIGVGLVILVSISKHTNIFLWQMRFLQKIIL